MNAQSSLPGLYRAHGFTVTPYLQALIDTYGETEVLPPKGEVATVVRWDDGRELVCDIGWLPIRFCPRRYIGWGQDHYELASTFMGSPVAPVGTTHRDNILLMLTEDGRLIGENDHLIMAWGPEGCDWRTSINAYLDGEEARVLGNSDPEEDEEEDGLA